MGIFYIYSFISLTKEAHVCYNVINLITGKKENVLIIKNLYKNWQEGGATLTVAIEYVLY